MNKKYDLICVGIANISLSVKPVSRDVFGTDVTLIDPIEVEHRRRRDERGPHGGPPRDQDLFGEQNRRRPLRPDPARRGPRRRGRDGAPRGFKERENPPPPPSSSPRTGTGTSAPIAAPSRPLCWEDLDMTLYDSAKIVNIGSLFALKMLDGDGVKKILERAKGSGGRNRGRI